jgi:hypothetical protein
VPSFTPPQLDPIPAPIVLGAANALSGSGFTAGSVVVLFVASPFGSLTQGPFVPTAWSPTTISWTPPASVPTGSGFGVVQIVNTDQGFLASNVQAQYLLVDPGAGIASITAINGVGLSPPDTGVPLANVATVIDTGGVATITGTGFSNPVVALFSSNPAVALEPLAGWTSTQLQVFVPADVPTGPGSVQVVNRPSFVGSVAVSVPLGEQIRLDSLVQNGDGTITVTGAGLSPLTIISFFNLQPSGVVNLGAIVNGTSLIPFTLQSSQQLTFTVPAGAVSGPAFVQLLNPPFIPFTSTGAAAAGAFTLVVP